MPTYNYTCPKCGTFSLNRPMAEYAEPQACPACETTSPRDLMSAPAVHGGGEAEAPFCGPRPCEGGPAIPGGCGGCCGAL